MAIQGDRVYWDLPWPWPQKHLQQKLSSTLTKAYLSLPETFGGVSSGGMREILGEFLLDGDVIRQTDVIDHHIVRAPLVEQLDFGKFLWMWVEEEQNGCKTWEKLEKLPYIKIKNIT